MPSFSAKKIAAGAAILLLLWLSARYLLPIALPFVLAVLLALAAEPLVSVFEHRLRLPRPAATGIGVSIALVVLILLITVLGALAVRQLQSLAGVMPDLGNTAMDGLSSLQGWLLELAEHTPESIRPLARQSVNGFFSDGSGFLTQLTSKLASLASGVVSKLPDSALVLGTWLLAGYMFSAKLPTIKCWLSSRLPAGWSRKYLPMLRQMKKSVLGWLGAQLKLIAVTFGVLAAGFFLLRISYAPVWAALISLVDALPVLGTGMILVPWSVVCLIQGDTMRAVGLLGVFAVATLLRSVLEPKLVGKQLGLDPLLTLVAMYAGYRLWGIGGMILAPLLAVIAVQLFTVPKQL